MTYMLFHLDGMLGHVHDWIFLGGRGPIVPVPLGVVVESFC